jgi:opacity protein-like surface antigen
MKTRITAWLMAGMMLMGFGVGTATAGEVKADINADVSILTDYVWRGQNYGKGGVIQPNLSIGFANGLSLGFWANYDMDEDRYSSSHLVNEIDYTLDYSFNAGPCGFSVGYIFYDFPRHGGNTEEVYGGVSLDTLLTPTLTLYRDVDSIDGTYISFGVSHDLELNDQTTLSLSGSLGWGNQAYHEGYFGVKQSSLSDYNLSAGLSYALTDKITVTPTLSYSGFADNDIGDAAEAGFYEDDTNLYGGINVSYSF